MANEIQLILKVDDAGSLQIVGREAGAAASEVDKLGKSKFVWSNTKRLIKSVDELSVMSCDISKDEMHRRIRAFHTNDFPISININGSKFVYQSE